MFDRENYKQSKAQELENEIKAQETLKPKLAPKTQKIVQLNKRDNLSREEYSNLLSARSP